MLGQDLLLWHLRESRLRKKFRKNRMRGMRLRMRRMKRRRRMGRRQTNLLLHLIFSDLHLHLFVWHLPVQWHFWKPWPPPMDSSLAAVLTGTSLSMSTSSSFRKEVMVGENWFLLYKLSSFPVLHPSLYNPPADFSRTTQSRLGNSQRP